MKFFNGSDKKKSYFEGWYFKHRQGEDAIAIIAAYHVDDYGAKKASVQIITNEKSYMVWYPGDQFRAEEDRLFIKIGNNIFFENGCRLNINTYDVRLKGDIAYGSFYKLAYDIMGPFQFVPKLQCSHGIISMGHRISGSLTLNGTYMNLTGGTGYIETDRGTSFPAHYTWVQCEERKALAFSIMAAIADIPMAFGSFTGCICAVCFEKKQYRFATYRNVKIRRNDSKAICLQQGHYTLLIQPGQKTGHLLHAPVSGNMNRKIKENLMGMARFRLWEDKHLIFDIKSTHVSMEREC